MLHVRGSAPATVRGDDSPGRMFAPRVIAGVAAAAAVLIAAQVYASHQHLTGPLASLLHDVTGARTYATTPWAGLALALIGLSMRARLTTVGTAVLLDLGFVLERMVRGQPFSIGNSPTLVLVGLALLAWLGWKGKARRNALHGIAIGALLIVASKISELWLAATSALTPQVLDQYPALADRALGDPAWRMGQLLAALGPAVSAPLHLIYVELPIGAMVVTFWQLRRARRDGWPAHHLVRTFLVLGVVGPVVYLLFPVVGPVYAFGLEGNGMQLGNLWPHILPPLSSSPAAIPFDGITPRNCMPSMHTAWALAIFIHTRREPVWLRWGGTGWLIATLCATLGFGLHYGVDLIAGAILCLTVESALRAPGLPWDRYRARLVASGLAVFATVVCSVRFFPAALAAAPVASAILLLGALALVALAFYACWFAVPGTALGRWGEQWLGPERTTHVRA